MATCYCRDLMDLMNADYSLSLEPQSTKHKTPFNFF